jgi:hypothetical protein
MNHSKNPKNPHRYERLIPEVAVKAPFTSGVCQAIINELNEKGTVVTNTLETITALKKLNETAAFINLIIKNSKLNSINTKEGYSESERKGIHHTIAKKAQALHDALTTLDRDVFYDWCIEDLFTKDNKHNVLNIKRLPDYDMEWQFYETLGSLAKVSNFCANKEKIELSGVTKDLSTRTGIDTALNAIIVTYTEITGKFPTTSGPVNLTRFEVFAHSCLKIMNYIEITDDTLRHLIKKTRANISKN